CGDISELGAERACNEQRSRRIAGGRAGDAVPLIGLGPPIEGSIEARSAIDAVGGRARRIHILRYLERIERFVVAPAGVLTDHDGVAGAVDDFADLAATVLVQLQETLGLGGAVAETRGGVDGGVGDR